MPESTINAVKARWQLLGLMFIPIGIVLLATFVFYTRIGMPEGTRNKGILIAPPLQLNMLGLHNQQGEPLVLEAKKDLWTFLVVAPSSCNDACKLQFWEVRQTRVALGKYQNYIRRLWIVTDGSLSEETQQWLKKEHSDMQVVYAESDAWKSLLKQSPQAIASELDVRFYLVDPRYFVMMYYRTADTYKDVIVDMKFLLKGVE
jgi:hypothetical protein